MQDVEELNQEIAVLTEDNLFLTDKLERLETLFELTHKEKRRLTQDLDELILKYERLYKTYNHAIENMPGINYPHKDIAITPTA